MSAAGQILDAIVTAAEAAVSGLEAERGLRHSQELEDGVMPHLFLIAPAARREQLVYRQIATTHRIEARLVTRYETQEASLLKLDAIQAAIDADPTLGGVVDTAFVPDDEPLEDHRERDRIYSFFIETRKVA